MSLYHATTHRMTRLLMRRALTVRQRVGVTQWTPLCHFCSSCSVDIGRAETRTNHLACSRHILQVQLIAETAARPTKDIVYQCGSETAGMQGANHELQPDPHCRVTIHSSSCTNAQLVPSNLKEPFQFNPFPYSQRARCRSSCSTRLCQNTLIVAGAALFDGSVWYEA